MLLTARENKRRDNTNKDDIRVRPSCEKGGGGGGVPICEVFSSNNLLIFFANSLFRNNKNLEIPEITMENVPFFYFREIKNIALGVISATTDVVCVGGHPFLHLLVDKISPALDESHVLF
jgi:hypothetical protein